jgi:HEAT repeat protein
MEERFFAARTCREAGSGAAPAVGALLEALGSEDSRVRAEVVRALGKAVESGTRPGAGPFASGQPFNPGWRVRPDVKTTLPRVAGLLRDPDRDVRRAVLETLEPFGADAAGDFARALKDPDTRWAASDLLFRMGETGKDAVPVLRTLLNDPRCAEEAAWALHSIDPVGTFPDILDLLKRKDAQVRQALEDAGKTGKAKATILALAALLEDPDVGKRTRAAHALWAIGPYLAEDHREYLHGVTEPLLKTVVPVAVGRLRSRDAQERRQALAEVLELRALHRLAPSRFGFAGATPADGKLAAVIDAALNAARNDVDLEVRRKARRATREFLHPRPTV